MTDSFFKTPCPNVLRLAGLALLAVAGAQPALAANISLSGNLAQDDYVQTLTLNLSGSGAVTVRGIGYAGGTDSYGNVVAAGGFDSVLYLFSNTGALIYQSDDGIGVPTDPATGEALDSAFATGVLAAGAYTLAIAQADNYLLGFNLSDGFAQAGNSNFSAAFGCSNGAFCDYQGNNRTSLWAINFSGNALAAVVPEPGSLALVLAAGWALMSTRRSRRTEPTAAFQPRLAGA